jgi:phytoene dehydrogenase-like protein
VTGRPTAVVDAVVVGSGPNGLAAAVTIAQAGLSVTVLEAAQTIGGGTRTEELTFPGVLHDVCSAVHPFGVASPYLASLPLAEHGLEWLWPEVDLAHPLDGGRAGIMVRSLDDTVEGLGTDGKAWRQTFGPLTGNYPALATELMQPILHLPRHPLTMASFGLRAGLPASVLARRFHTDEARALFGGIAAHMFSPLNRPLTASVGTTFVAAAHDTGWPVARGGSASITRALAAVLGSLGGTIQTGVTVTSLADLPPARITLFDTSPTALAAIAGDRLPARVARAYRQWSYGPGAYKVDLAVEGGIPWTNEACRRAGTVHVGGTFEEVAAGEAQLHRGRLPERPFVLVAQQYLCDPSRSAGDVHPVWTYAHVPNRYRGDVTEGVLDHLERFAPRVRDRIVGQHVMTPGDFASYNSNYVGGDVAGGASTGLQLVFRPRVTLDPYSTGVPGMYLCSAATPPGAGVHGMCGHNAARRALRELGLTPGSVLCRLSRGGVSRRRRGRGPR